MLYLLFYRRHLISGIILLQKGKPPVDYYHQGKDFFYFGVLLNLIRAYFFVREKI